MQASNGRLAPEDAASLRRRGHAPQISISDDNHHVTEAIGDMYGDSEWDGDTRRSYLNFASQEGSGRPLSFMPGPDNPSTDSPLARSLSGADRHTETGDLKNHSRARRTSGGSISTANASPDLSRSPSTDTASQHFPLNDIDYESSPAAVAQELSNLQAIRRMSMNVDLSDPDLPQFGAGFSVPSVAPDSSTDEDDASRLFWVPARLHPELAPKEFKTFVEDRVDHIQRRSREGTSLSPDGLSRSPSSINRRRSMLSKTFESGADFHDGAEILERKRSSRDGSSRSVSGETSLEELESLVNDPASLVRKMSIDSARRSLETEEGAEDDMPLMPQPAGSQPLKRSTRTNYRRGSLRKGERVLASRRAAARHAAASDDAEPTSPPNSQANGLGIKSLQRVQTEPSPAPNVDDHGSTRVSRRTVRPVHSFEDVHEAANETQEEEEPESEPSQAAPQAFQSRFASNGRTTAAVPQSYGTSQRIPAIVETPPRSDGRPSSLPPQAGAPMSRPERSSSHGHSRQTPLSGSTQKKSQFSRTSSKKQNQTLDDMANNPSMMPGNSMSTDALSFIPTFDEDRPQPDADRKSDRKKSSDGPGLTKKSSWGWLLGSDDKEKDPKKEREEPALAKKAKAKFAKLSDKADRGADAKSQDSARLDVLSSSSDVSEVPRGRESLVLDRASLKLEEERKKDSHFRRSGEGKKESSNIFSSLFGGKKKGDRDSTGKKPSSRGLSPEPPKRILRPDIDYNWTRFSILEERAIYRMAHIKLANPRRALYSQVLLSNFMYSYLAKVQQMHPQIQIPQYIQQKNQRQSEEQQKQPEDYSTWQRYQEQQERLNKPEADDGDYDSQSGFIEDYDANHQQRRDDRAAAAAGNRHYNGDMDQESWDQRNHYIQDYDDDDDAPDGENRMW